MMKRFLGILVLGLLWCSISLAEENKAWEIDGKYLTPKCFLYEWLSSDNFEDYYNRYTPENKKWKDWWSNIGLYYGKEIPLEDSFKTSWGDYTLSLTRYLKDCTSPEPITKDWETEKKEVLSRYWISREIPKKYCEIFAPNVNAKCLDLKLIELMREFTAGSMRPVGYLFVSGIFELANNDKIIIPLKYIYDYKKFIASLEN